MDVARTEAADAELARMIERRSRKGEVDRDELEPLYMESVRLVQRPPKGGEPPRLAELLLSPGQRSQGQGRGDTTEHRR